MAANTPVTYYIDTPAAQAACQDERRDIDRKCKPEPPQSDEDEKKGKPRKRKKGLSGKLAPAMSGQVAEREPGNRWSRTRIFSGRR